MNEGTALMVPPELSLSRPTLLTGTTRFRQVSRLRKVNHRLFSSTSKLSIPSPTPTPTPTPPFSESSATPDNALKGIAALEGFFFGMDKNGAS